MILLEEEESLLIDGVYMDSALVGVGRRCGQPLLAVYDRDKLMQGFIDRGRRQEDAEEGGCRKVEGAWVGESTPLVVEAIDDGG